MLRPWFCDWHLRKITANFVSRQKSQLCIPRKPRKIGVWVSGAEIQTSAVDTRTSVWVSTAEKFSKLFWEKLGNFLESLGGSQRQLCIKTCYFRRVKSTHGPATFEKYRDAPPISIAILCKSMHSSWHKSSKYTTNLYHGTAPICIAILLQKYQDQGSLEHSQILLRKRCQYVPTHSRSMWKRQDRQESGLHSRTSFGEASKVQAYHLSQNYCIAAHHFLDIHFGRRNVKTASQNCLGVIFWVP